MRVLVATDAFRPQINGVVRSLEALAATAPELGASVDFLSPHGFPTVPMPTYREIKLAVTGVGGIRQRIGEMEDSACPFDHIHIATEGPVGLATRRYCLRRRRAFTTSYHTRFPEYVSARSPIPAALTYALLRRFHRAGQGTMVSTPTLARELAGRGFPRLMIWSRGVDLDQFSPARRRPWNLPRPIFLFAGRLAPEKNIESFLQLELPGSKVVVGDGPSAASLKQRFPEAHFPGIQQGDALARLYASADVFVFPSRTDTFGMVLLESLASGTPVAALPVPGPIDVIGGSDAGVLDLDLKAACLAAADIPRARARRHAEKFTWRKATEQFLNNAAAARATYPPRASISAEERELFWQGQAVEL